MKIFASIELPKVKDHPNRVPFRGVLTMVGVPSDKSPAGARGHLCLLTETAARDALGSLLGMGLDYASDFERHNVKRKIGFITYAEIKDKELTVRGFLYGRDFPEIVEMIRRDSSKLGLSYELHDSRIENIKEEIWVLSRVTFTGAAIIKRSKCAYRKTWIELDEGSAG